MAATYLEIEISQKSLDELLAYATEEGGDEAQAITHALGNRDAVTIKLAEFHCHLYLKSTE